MSQLGRDETIESSRERHSIDCLHHEQMEISQISLAFYQMSYSLCSFSVHRKEHQCSFARVIQRFEWVSSMTYAAVRRQVRWCSSETNCWWTKIHSVCDNKGTNGDVSIAWSIFIRNFTASILTATSRHRTKNRRRSNTPESPSKFISSNTTNDNDNGRTIEKLLSSNIDHHVSQ